MTKASVRDTLAELEAEYGQLKKQREFHVNKVSGIDQRMNKVQKAIASLAALEGDTPAFKGKMSYAMRAILALADRPLLTTDFRHYLAVIGYDLTQHDNVMATIGSVLKRLVSSTEAIPIDSVDGCRYARGPNLLVDPDHVLKWLNSDPKDLDETKIALHRKALLTSSWSQPAGHPNQTLESAERAIAISKELRNRQAHAAMTSQPLGSSIVLRGHPPVVKISSPEPKKTESDK